ncbi:hypothetical protein D3C73_1097910 [compost metagenome]
MLEQFTGVDIQHQSRFRLRVIGDKQTARLRVFCHIQQQRRFLTQRLPAFLYTLITRVDHQDFATAIGGINTLSDVRVMQTGHPFTGVFDTGFQLQGFGIHHPNYRRVSHRANIEQAIMQQHLARTVRETFGITFREQYTIFHFTIGGIQGAQAAVQ